VRTKRLIAPTLLVVLLGVLLVKLPLAIADRSNDYEFFDPIIDIRALIIDRFVEEPDEDAMLDAAISGMVETLGDQHTIYIPPADVENFNKDLRGTYVGIGSEVSTQDGYLKIVTPMDDSPSLEAGVLAGDLVLEIEGESTFEQPVNDSIDRLLGTPNTPVTIKVRHLDGVEEELTITRRQIRTRTVRGLRRHGEDWTHCVDEERDIAYVRVTQFNQKTVGNLRALLLRLSADGLGGLILDLRDNHGGELRGAVEMSDMFLDDGVIVSIKDRRGDGPTFSARPNDDIPDVPIVVLINESSASASEIVAGALQENGRAKLLGTRSHGKGSVQEVRELPFDRGTLKLTTAYYYLPSGRSLHRRDGEPQWGVDPDYLRPISDEDYIAHIRARREFEIIRAADGEAGCDNSDWIRESLLDHSLADAVDLIASRIDTGDWDESGEDLEAGQIAMQQELFRYLEARNRRMAELERIDERIGDIKSMIAVDAAEAVEPMVPTDLDLLAGTITLRDADGNVVGAYRIDGGNVPLALEAMRLTPVEAPSEE
jgi:carboxyl-terminal processing protease